MKINIIAVGKIKERYLKEGIAEYSKRLSRFCDLRITEVADEPAPDNLSAAQEEQVRSKEAARVLGKVKDGTYLIVLDVEGVKKSSDEFAAVLKNCMTSGNSNITFVIGGSLGLAPELIKKANLRLSLSDMTFPHQLTRLILLEQIYRVFKIINGEPYHK
ncbi:MAG: 23S rRNA (pseudouridine(1915)-N(3))-methyltransferase RlmH [Acetivibrionales bacterium]|jgi:23S rRNA (pseudouridine1915-N3)-methyltransferase|nr:23S rRNA (pseudouridine(1915)-N(3))-methyltransferase RlmH [Bacillota bacterium]NLP06823.1 23S rRNA (pseudouridine(1915)-N(3))-methyltransferase RlmH [Clostridiaceae bacterium]HOA56068.1 23S rRNA (pseudouridine(1915)-N(3))-methyltransferase RlmH [Clostridiales bacterium]HPZ05545.1 23S rRNA (pseudouridine(1915)-N(3))-methyltransferase RlmH [Clostridiales bacterium]HQD32050.1 23S rRNA (pseudouridine(1915)-N(3))-methyltransferase RlmH [Clostridiales bacterium]